MFLCFPDLFVLLVPYTQFFFSLPLPSPSWLLSSFFVLLLCFFLREGGRVGGPGLELQAGGLIEEWEV